MKKMALILLTVIAGLFVVGNLGATSVTIDHVVGLYINDSITCGPITYYLRYTNDRDYPIGGIDNGFRIYTLGGAPFLIPEIDTLPWPGPDGGGWTTEDHFGLIFSFTSGYGTNDGAGADTVGVGGAKGTGIGLPIGFDYPAVTITTGLLDVGDILCLDSSWCKPNHAWVWAPGSGNPSEKPSWGGPYCYPSTILSCGYPTFDICHDTVRTVLSDPIVHEFHANPFQPPPSEVVYELFAGPGTIDSASGLWSATLTSDQVGIPIDLDIGAWETRCTRCNVQHCTYVVFAYVLGDLNINGASDIGDLIFLSEYMFGDGEPPQVIELADVNGDGTLDISDLIYLVDYMFGDGPPPVNPWP